ncbi:MAG: phosphomannomutase/phosphoglucomutase [Kiritimatiellae bacterium]|nr:phosphomannomutase/phosphoglucomutase [Kiritimatiellia bacterium]
MGFFKAYDMRGTYGVDFDLATVYEVGKALVEVVGGKRWLVGRDCRVTSADVHDALIEGLREAGAEVTDIGLCTTPMVYFFTAEDDFDGSVMVTASHNPPSDNGLKVSKRGALPVGYADGLHKVESLVMERLSGVDRKAYKPSPTDPTDNSQYLKRYVEWMRPRGGDIPSSLKYAVDCSNGMSSLLVHELFPGAVVVNDVLDGRFPNHSPNPLKADAREQLSRLVRERSLDFGIIFDGDADRAMFVDERGEFIQPDYLTPFVAEATFSSLGLKSEGQSVIYDVRTSRGAIETLAEMSCKGVMVPVGHAFAKPILRETGAVCGGELAGHYYFKEFFGCDSGVLAALRVLKCVANAAAEGKSASAMVAKVNSRYANSGELNFKVDDKDAAIARALDVASREFPAEISRSGMDGVRIEYASGWINIRKSNTEPYLRLIVEADDSSKLDKWVELLSAAIRNA